VMEFQENRTSYHHASQPLSNVPLILSPSHPL
jgi:hypothetical protein